MYMCCADILLYHLIYCISKSPRRLTNWLPSKRLIVVGVFIDVLYGAAANVSPLFLLDLEPINVLVNSHLGPGVFLKRAIKSKHKHHAI